MHFLSSSSTFIIIILILSNLISLCLFFFCHVVACGILVPQPGIEPTPPAVEARRLNHWTTREVPSSSTFKVGILLHKNLDFWLLLEYQRNQRTHIHSFVTASAWDCVSSLPLLEGTPPKVPANSRPTHALPIILSGPVGF